METVASVASDLVTKSLAGHSGSIVQVSLAGGAAPNLNVLPNAHSHHLQNNFHAVQVQNLDDSDSQRPDVLARRPSYRKILNDISGEGCKNMAVTKIEEESNSAVDTDDEEDLQHGAINASSVLSGGSLQVSGQGDGSGLQTLTMTNATGQSAASPPSAPAIVQYAQGPEGQFFIPVTALSTGTVQAYQLTSQSSLPQGVVMATTGGAISASGMGEDGTRKRELRLLKNREAARECRRKKKEYVKCLENRVAVLEQQNKALIEELKSLKELYCQKDG